MINRGKIEENIRNAINSNNNLSSNKKILEEIFGNLLSYNDDKFSELYSEMTAEKNRNPKYWRIITSVTASDSDLKKSGWSFISSGESSSKIIGRRNESAPDDRIISKVVKRNDSFIIASAYLMCRISDIDRYCGWEKKYKGIIDGKEFEYMLILSDKMITEEKKIFETADIYNIRNAVLYSPMTRRFVYIMTKSTDFENIKNLSEHDISLEFEENGLYDLIQLNIRCIWNIEFDDVSSSKNIRAYEDDKKQQYIYSTLENQYIMPENLEYVSDKKIIRFNNSETIIETSENIVSQQRRMSVISPDQCNQETADFNYCFDTAETIDSAVRIRSKADIESVVYQFTKSHSIRLADIRSSSSGMNICRYKRGFEYPVLNSDFLGFSGKDIFLKFENDDNDIFFEDRIIFIINYLQMNYPEFNWKGGY